MYPPLQLRALPLRSAREVGKLVGSQTASVRLARRAKIVQLASQGKTIPQVTAELGCAPKVVRKWFKRFEAQGLAGLNDAPRSGAPPRYTAENKARVVATARTRPRELGLPYSSWTFERLATYLQEALGLPLKKTRIFEMLREEGLRWRQQETWFGARLAPEFAQKGED